MATVYTKEFQSALTDGEPFQVAATASPGDTIHTAHATAKDEVWLWATNTDTVERKLTVEFGGVAAKNQIEVKLPPESGPIKVIEGWILSNSKLVKVFGQTTNVINVSGYVNRITTV